MVAAIIPNWNGRDFILDCLKSLSELRYPPERLQIIVVDNGSSDGSQEAIRRVFIDMEHAGYEHLQLIENAVNLGAPAAYNQAIQCVHPECEFIWKLDNDVTFDSQCLTELLNIYDRDGNINIGAVGGKVLNVRTGGEDPIGARLKTPPRLWAKIVDYVYSGQAEPQLSHAEEVDMVSGSCCLFPKCAFDANGLFDERFFLYYDDTEFCLRLKKNGWRLFVVTDALVYHHGYTSTTLIPACRLYYWLRNHLLLGKCYFAGVERLLFYLVHVLNLPWKFLRIVHRYADGQYALVAKTMFRAYCDFVVGRFGPCPEELRKIA